MSKLISVFHRNAIDLAEGKRRIRSILEAITPDIARDRAHTRVDADGHHLLGTLNLPSAARRDGMSLCQGKIYGPSEGWAEPGAPAPDGSFALIRDNADFLEAVTDPTATRSLWYYFDDDVFVVSNAQRAVTLYTGRFAFEPAVVPWLVSTGGLGLGMSYNRHLRLLPAAGSVLLDKAAWTIRLRAGELRVVPAPGPRTEHRAALEAALVDTLAAFGPQDVDQTILGLSGGADSRGIGAILVRARPDLRWKSFTGGPAEAQGVPMTDATVSAEVAARLGTEHRFVLNRASPEPIVTVLDRFVQASEGRIDHLGGYLDGFAGLNALSADGIGVIIRGDTSFGGPLWEPLNSEFAMRQTINLLLCREISNLAPHVERFGLAGQRLPDLLPRHDCESLLSWRDRLYLQFRTATVLQALTETKSAFVDIVNPLMSRRALAVSCALPDDLRLDKALFREVVRDLVPDLPFARDHGGVTVPEVLNRPEVRRMLAASLASDTAREVFGAPFVDWVRREIDPLHRARVKALRKLTSWLGGRRPAPGSPALPIVHPLRLAFRVHMARTMIDQLRADAARFVNAPPLAPDPRIAPRPLSAAGSELPL